MEPFPDDWSRALVVVAHPDDMEWGASAAVARWAADGKSVAYVLVTSGEAGIDSVPPAEAKRVREGEQRAACAAVGVEVVEFLGYPDGVIEYGLPLRRDIAGAVRRHRPEVVVTVNHRLTWGGRALNMADHRAVGLAVFDAARDAGNRWVFTDLGLEPWAGVRWVALSGSPEPTHAVDVAEHIEAGIASLEAHRAYIDGLGTGFDPRAFVTGLGDAVAFELFEL